MERKASDKRLDKVENGYQVQKKRDIEKALDNLDIFIYLKCSNQLILTSATT